MRTWLSSTLAATAKRAPMRPASDSGSRRIQQNDVAADLLLQLGRRAQRDQISVTENRQPVAALGLFHQVCGHDDGHPLLIAQDLQVLPQVAPRARIEPGGRFVEQQHRWTVQQALGQFQAALHAAGERLDAVFGAVGQAHAAQHLAARAFSAAPRNP